MSVAERTAADVRIDVYGLGARIGGDWPEVVDAIRRDFAWFERPAGSAKGQPGAAGAEGDAHLAAAVEVEIQRRPPDYDALGDAVSSFVTPRNVVYQTPGRTVIDYFGRAVSILDRATGSLVVQGEDSHLVHEAAYLFLLSRVGEHLDARGLPRLHALAVSGSSGAVGVILPSGGGKSTMALRALQADGVRLLSEDSPLMDRRGRLHPFPLRIGINESDAAELGDAKVRRIERMEFHPKVLLDLEAFEDRIESRPQPLRHLVLGRRSLGREAALEPLPKREAVGPLLREAVVGVGLYQGMEFVLQSGMRDVLGKSGIAARRAACCAAALRAARVWRLTIGRDHRRNWEALEPLLQA